MLLGIRRRFVYYCVNQIYCGTNPKYWNRKRSLLNWIGHSVGEGTKIVGPVKLYGVLQTGKNVWLGEDFSIEGLGRVYIGDNCDIAPSVMCLTGSHVVGDHNRRAGKGINEDIKIGDGCWICGRATLIGGVNVGSGSVVAASALVVDDIPPDMIVGGVPAKVIKSLE